MVDRGLILLPDKKDSYVNEMRSQFRRGKDQYFLDRLLVAGIVEARGAERFGMVAQALPAGKLKLFYESITRSEEDHMDLFMTLANSYFKSQEVQTRLAELLDAEAAVVSNLPLRPALH